MTKLFEGGCLCGAVRYSCSAQPLVTVHCCCADCRRIGGTGHATHSVVPAESFILKGRVTEFQKTADSGNSISRFFCPLCGSAIYHTRDGMEGLVVLRSSSLDDPEIVTPERVIYTGSAVSWDHIDPALPAFGKMSNERLLKPQ
jgi:hypothetical protein